VPRKTHPKTAAAKSGEDKPTAKKPLGRPSSFKQETADAICERLALGESLRAICAAPDMPCLTAVFKWLATFPDFATQYARAREEQAEFYAGEIVEISDEEVTTIRRGKHQPDAEDPDEEVEIVYDSAAVARNRLRVDARKWYASKLAPKKYGDKVTQEVTGPDGGPVNMLLGVATSEELKKHIRGEA
jgi:hypothetical protein